MKDVNIIFTRILEGEWNLNAFIDFSTGIINVPLGHLSKIDLLAYTLEHEVAHPIVTDVYGTGGNYEIEEPIVVSIAVATFGPMIKVNVVQDENGEYAFYVTTVDLNLDLSDPRVKEGKIGALRHVIETTDDETFREWAEIELGKLTGEFTLMPAQSLLATLLKTNIPIVNFFINIFWIPLTIGSTLFHELGHVVWGYSTGQKPEGVLKGLVLGEINGVSEEARAWGGIYGNLVGGFLTGVLSLLFISTSTISVVFLSLSILNLTSIISEFLGAAILGRGDLVSINYIQVDNEVKVIKKPGRPKRFFVKQKNKRIKELTPEDNGEYLTNDQWRQYEDGFLPSLQGWKFHIAATSKNYIDILEIVVPILKEKRIFHKVTSTIEEP